MFFCRPVCCLCRSHGLADVYAAIEAMHQCGATNWSLDLISGLPHLTPDKWEFSLDQAIAANPTHISVYDLQVSMSLLADRPLVLCLQRCSAQPATDNKAVGADA